VACITLRSQFYRLMDIMKYDVQLLYYDTRFSLWQVEMRALFGASRF
jgi:hypothetical protein